MAPTKGRIVIFRQAEGETPHNGSVEHPAIVNHAFGAGEFPALNLTVFPDGSAPSSRTSVPHKSNATPGGAYWDWPPRA